MATIFKLKKSTVAYKIPTAASLQIGELGINLTDRRLYSKDSAGAVFMLSESPTEQIVASQALVAGSFVNVWNNAGTISIRAASAYPPNICPADGFILSAVASGGVATVYFSGRNHMANFQDFAPGIHYLNSGGASSTFAPTTKGCLVQRIGFALTINSINFQRGEAYGI